MINSANERVPFSKAATGTYTLPLNLSFASADEYDVVIESGGSLDPGSKTALLFDVTATGADPVVGYIVSNVPMASAEVP
jgi:hypothetical protein